MRIQLLSDLHLEQSPGFRPVPAAGADVLVLAGDIGSYQPGSALTDDDFGLARFSPSRPGASWRTVFYVPGNHEYDTLDFMATRQRLRGLCDRYGITWLDEVVVPLDGVRFLGTTLWADYDALARGEPTDRGFGRIRADETRLTWQLRQREKAFRAANHYLSTNTTFIDGRPLLAEPMRALSLDCQRWLEAALAEPFDGPTVVVTHFAPSLRSHDPRYGLTPGTAGFCNAMDALVPMADLWLHGHLHCHHDYVIEGVRRGAPARCRVVANPLGYDDRGEQEGFVPDLAIEVPGA